MRLGSILKKKKHSKKYSTVCRVFFLEFYDSPSFIILYWHNNLIIISEWCIESDIFPVAIYPGSLGIELVSDISMSYEEIVVRICYIKECVILWDVISIWISSISYYRSSISINSPCPIFESCIDHASTIWGESWIHVSRESTEVSFESCVEAIGFFSKWSSKVDKITTLIFYKYFSNFIKFSIKESAVMYNFNCAIMFYCIDTIISIHSKTSFYISLF